MSGDSEKRLQKVLDKLYQSPRPKPYPSRGISSVDRGKRPELGSRAGLGEGLRLPTVASMGMLGPTPPCRPWDRGDLMRRLATFKAMTWFGKPKVVRPVNCARRGWINVEMDVIACEACGTRLLFSTPSSWTLQQVEKAAAVFSLKLDNGHKLLCPWIDNACDEALALFPPTPPPALVESYNERSSALLRLAALPIISSSAIDYMKMKSPTLEEFLTLPSHASIVLKNGIRLTVGPKSKDWESALEAANSDLYYQALKIVSLCGWEPRLLPYAVESEDISSSFGKGTSTSETSEHILHEQKEGVKIHSSNGQGEAEGGEHINPPFGDYQYDPASVVLDCRFCGARAALWALTTVQCPLEIFSVVADSSSQNEPATFGADLVRRVQAPRVENLGVGIYSSNKGISDTGYSISSAKEKNLGLNFSIAGGPPPTRQNYRPRVSFPIVSRHLRAELSVSRNHASFEDSSSSQTHTQHSSQNDDLLQYQKDINGSLVIPECASLLKRKRSENELSSDVNFQSHPEGEIRGGNNTPSGNTSFEGNYSEQGDHSLHKNSNVENPKDAIQCAPEVLQRTNIDYKEKGEVPPEENKADNSVKVGEGISTIQNDAEPCGNNLVMESEDVCNQICNSVSRLDSVHYGEASETNHDDLSNIASCSSTKAALSSSHNINSGKGDKDSDLQNIEDAKAINQKANGLMNVSGKAEANHAPEKNPKLVHSKINKFDPIRQHRPFCPWIAPNEGVTMPGWKLTLSAVVHQVKDSPTPLNLENPSDLLDEEDDPIISVRKLFMSPPPKRLKSSQ
ncbi:uncharacterized protein LOC103715939 isoform X1 [Phoenix dactylifera]|uniref:Uncharacterized protein LOC103715939 isoform X1 n=1 Tax=Phoenix dactylifera TaxID=42345 RepID=A0A8B9AEB1_PHODC|nr:uncharacterized protein LOC103715939 isoform X1 [Phoenix dactylifera]